MDEIEKIKDEKMKRFMESMNNKTTEIEVNDKNFDNDVIERSKKTPVVVDFWAKWCMPCLMLGPILEKLAKKYNGKFILAKMNVDESPLKSREYAVVSIPSVKMFKNGKVVDEFIGALPEHMVRQWLDKNIG